MKFLRPVLTNLLLGLPALCFAQAPTPATANYIGVEIGTVKVGLNCPANAGCSRVDSSGILRFGHRFDPSWAIEALYLHTDADWGVFGANYSARVESFGLGAAYTVPLSGRVGAVLRLGAASNHLKLQPAVAVGNANPGTVSTQAVKPYAGLALSWQFARHWSTSLNADWTRADLREAANGPKQAVTVRTFGAGIAVHF